MKTRMSKTNLNTYFCVVCLLGVDFAATVGSDIKYSSSGGYYYGVHFAARVGAFNKQRYHMYTIVSDIRYNSSRGY